MACCNIFTTNLIFIGLDVVCGFFGFLKLETETGNLYASIFYFLILAFLGLEIFGTFKKNLYAIIAACTIMCVRYLGSVVIATIAMGKNDHGQVRDNDDYVVAKIYIYLIVWQTLRIFIQSYIIHDLSGPHLKRKTVMRKEYGSLA